MKNKKGFVDSEWFGTFLFTSFIGLAIGTFVAFVKAELKEDIFYEYTVWVGSAAVSVGYSTNDWEQEGDFILFKSQPSGRSKRIPLASIMEIEDH
jgi:hypothetical protein